MGDDTPSTGSSARQILGALQMYAPDAIKAISATLPDTAKQELAAAEAVEPGYENLYRQNQLATAGTEADVIEGPGQRLVTAADKYQRQLDPEYYAQRSLMNESLNKYLGGYDPYNLSPTEEAQISRGLGASGMNQQPSAMNTVRAAQVFGDAGTKRWQNFGDAITKAAASIPALKSGLNGFDIASQRGTNNAAQTSAGNALSSNFGFSTSALGDISGAANAALAKKKTGFDQLIQVGQTFSPSAQFGGIL